MPSRNIVLTLSLVVSAQLRAEGTISFVKDIQPILESSCWKCHGSAIQLSKLDLRSREAALAGGAHGPAIVPGNPDGSKLYRMIAGLDKPIMPMDGKLSAEQVQKIRKWIEEGGQWDGATTTQSAKTAAADL